MVKASVHYKPGPWTMCPGRFKELYTYPGQHDYPYAPPGARTAVTYHWYGVAVYYPLKDPMRSQLKYSCLQSPYVLLLGSL